MRWSTGDTEFLRLMLRTMHEYGIDPASLIHALQNHDELTLELVHFWTLHKDDVYTFQGREWTGGELREHIRSVMYDRLTGENAPYNLRFVTNGVASTTVSVIAAALGMRDVWNMTPDEKAQVQRGASAAGDVQRAAAGRLCALRLGPGRRAAACRRDAVEQMLADGDTRWIHRGAYDLMGVNPGVRGVVRWACPGRRRCTARSRSSLQRPDSFAAPVAGDTGDARQLPHLRGAPGRRAGRGRARDCW